MSTLTLVPKREGPGAPSSWFKELAGVVATRPGTVISGSEGRGRGDRRQRDATF
jgi:hypothetical protein